MLLTSVARNAWRNAASMARHSTSSTYVLQLSSLAYHPPELFFGAGLQAWTYEPSFRGLPRHTEKAPRWRPRWRPWWQALNLGCRGKHGRAIEWITAERSYSIPSYLFIAFSPHLNNWLSTSIRYSLLVTPVDLPHNLISCYIILYPRGLVCWLSSSLMLYISLVP